MTALEIRIYGVSITEEPSVGYQCLAKVDIDKSAPYTFRLTIPASCYDLIISEFRQIQLISEIGHGEHDILGATELQRVFADIFRGAIRQYIEGHRHVITKPAEILLGTLDPREVSSLVTRCYRTHRVEATNLAKEFEPQR